MTARGRVGARPLAIVFALLALRCSGSPTDADTATGGPPPVPFLVRDVSPGRQSSEIGRTAVTGNRLFFVTGPQFDLEELWRTDGTAAGTVRVERMPDVVRGLVTFGDRLLVSLNEQLWSTDGSVGGRSLVKEFPSIPLRSYTYIHNVTVAGDHALFVATSGTGATYTSALWRTDGRAAGTVTLHEFPATGYNGYPGFLHMAAAGADLYFAGHDTAHGTELWRSDGTPDGTALVKELVLGANVNNGPELLTPLGRTLLFFPNLPADREELWRSDGTEAGTRPVTIFGPRSVPGPCAARGAVFFAANDGVHGEELWRTDGTPSGTQMVRDILPGTGSSFPAALTAVGGVVYFSANDGVHGAELWRTDGSAGGTRLVADLAPGPADSFPSALFDGNGRLFFLRTDELHGGEPWTSDGTRDGTALVQDIRPGASSSGVRWLGATSSHVFFAADDGVSGREVWAMAVVR